MVSLDWIIIGIFILCLIGIILWVVRQKQKDSADYFLSGKDATWIAICASIFASNIGSEHLIGLAGTGASSGMAMAHWEIQGWIILLLGWVFVPFYSRSMVFTMPEFLERPQPIYLRSILTLSIHLRLCIPSGLFPSGIPTNNIYAFLVSPIRATCPAHIILLDLIILIILVEEYKL